MPQNIDLVLYVILSDFCYVCIRNIIGNVFCLIRYIYFWLVFFSAQTFCLFTSARASVLLCLQVWGKATLPAISTCTDVTKVSTNHRKLIFKWKRENQIKNPDMKKILLSFFRVCTFTWQNFFYFNSRSDRLFWATFTFFGSEPHCETEEK